MNRIVEISCKPNSEKGFTLVELLVSMAISLVVMGAVYSTYRSQQTSYVIQDQVSGAQQNLRAAMYTMTRDIRTAGFNPTQVGGNIFGVTAAGNNTITIKSDNSATPSEYGNGAADPGETIIYSLAADGRLMRDTGGGNQVLAENIAALGFAYAYDQTANGTLDLSANNNIIWAVDSDGNNQLDLNLDTNDDGVIALNDAPGGASVITGTALASQVPVTAVKSVKIWLLARTAQQISGYRDTGKYVVGKTIFTPAQGFMYRLMAETARCRNL
jgi:type IV pilus assembly protein PilW